MFGSRETACVARDWGIWCTVTSNLEPVHTHMGRHPQLTEESRRSEVECIDMLRAAIEQAPKSMTWDTRSLMGDKVKWYEDIEEVSDRI